MGGQCEFHNGARLEVSLNILDSRLHGNDRRKMYPVRDCLLRADIGTVSSKTLTRYI